MQQPTESPEAVFAQQMRARRESLGMPQTALALTVTLYGAKVDPTAVTRMEKGTRAIRLNEAVAVARALGVPLATLLEPPRDADEELAAARAAAVAAEAELASANAEWARAEQHAEEVQRARLAAAQAANDAQRRYAALAAAARTHTTEETDDGKHREEG